MNYWSQEDHENVGEISTINVYQLAAYFFVRTCGLSDFCSIVNRYVMYVLGLNKYFVGLLSQWFVACGYLNIYSL